MRGKGKNIVVYFGKEKENKEDPFVNFGHKKGTYLQLFKKGSEDGHRMYISSGRKSYLGDCKFCNILEYQNEKFSPVDLEIDADAIFDRSGGLRFPGTDISQKVLNNFDFKKLCADKMLTYDFIGEFMPESFSVNNIEDFILGLKNFKEDELVVFKPVAEFGGAGIIIGKPAELKKCKFEKNKKYLLQKFVETSSGVEGIVGDRHDVRIIIANGEMVLAHVRVPKKGSLLANVAQGGSIKEIALEKIPLQIIEIVKKVQEKIDTKFDKPLYSIDFGVSGNKPYIFELNDQIGFPAADMQNTNDFINAVVDSLKERCLR